MLVSSSKDILINKLSDKEEKIILVKEKVKNLEKNLKTVVGRELLKA